jgi:PAS domain-containing protein
MLLRDGFHHLASALRVDGKSHTQILGLSPDGSPEAHAVRTERRLTSHRSRRYSSGQKKKWFKIPIQSESALMAQQSVEMILVRQLASYLFVPVLVVDTTGTVVFYNEPAERILGVRFEETGRIGPEEVERLIELSDDPAAGPDEAGRPMATALQQRRPAHARRWLLRRGDRVRLQVELTAFPVIDQEDRLLGAVAMFWERLGP